MAELPYMPFFVTSYLADTSHLSEEEHGAYLRLLSLAWTSPECRLPNDDAWLARRLSRSIEMVRNLYRPIIAEFWQTDGNWVWQKRQREEFERSRKVVRKKVAAAKTRWKHEAAVTAAKNSDPDNALKNNENGRTDAYASISTFRKKESETPTPAVETPALESESGKAPAGASPYRFSGQLVKLKEGHYEAWRKNYFAIEDLSAELQRIDDWLIDEADDRQRKNWFQLVSGALRKRHLKLLPEVLEARKGEANRRLCERIDTLEKEERRRIVTEGGNPYSPPNEVRVRAFVRSGLEAAGLA